MPKCSACLVAGSNHYLNNFLTILNAACQQQPASGSILAVSGSPFSTTPVTITDPSPIPTAALRPEDSGPLNLGAKVGIAVGGLLVLLGTAGCCIVWNGRRRRRRFLRRLHEKATAPAAGSGPRYGGGAGDAEGAGSWPSPQNHGETPMSQRPLRGWDDSPTERNRPSSRYFSPYSSQYNSPVSAVEASGMFAWPTEKLIASTTTSPVQQQQQSPQELHQHQNGLGIGIAIGGADASREDVTATGYPADVKGKDRDGAPEGEAYEMQRVEPSTVVPMPAEPQAPVLHHPGYGRHYQGRPETDLRAGQAV